MLCFLEEEKNWNKHTKKSTGCETFPTHPGQTRKFHNRTVIHYCHPATRANMQQQQQQQYMPLPSPYGPQGYGYGVGTPKLSPATPTCRIPTKGWSKDKPVSSVILTVYSGASYDGLFREVVQEPPEETLAVSLFQVITISIKLYILFACCPNCRISFIFRWDTVPLRPCISA